MNHLMRKKKKTKRGFTDRLYFTNLLLSWLFLSVCVLLTIFSGSLGITDMAIVTYGVPAVFAELSLHTGFVIWKAKAENMQKFGRNDDIQFL